MNQNRGRLHVQSIQELSSFDFVGTSLLHEGLSKRMVALDEELVPLTEALKQPEASLDFHGTGKG